MARYGRGLICLTLTRERCRQLRLPLMVSETDSAHRTNFTLSIEAAEGVTTGISAHDRAHTVKTAVAPKARPEDLRQPGHIFPLMAQPGGVLTRAGHTEAGCDLARLAGFSPAAMIVEILNDDGTMARRPDLERFAQDAFPEDRHHRRSHPLPAEERALGGAHLRAAGRHRIRRVSAVLLRGSRQQERAHRPGEGRFEFRRCRPWCACTSRTRCGTWSGVRNENLGWPLRAAVRRVAAEPSGVVVILRPEETPREFMDSVRQLDAEAAGRARLPAPRCCAPTASARRSSRTSG